MNESYELFQNWFQTKVALAAAEVKPAEQKPDDSGSEPAEPARPTEPPEKPKPAKAKKPKKPETPEPPVEPEAPKTPGFQLQRHHKIYGAATVSVLLIVLAGWLASAQFAARLNVAGKTVPANASAKTIQAAITKQAQAYKLTIAHPDGAKKQYSLSQIGLSLDTKASLQQTKQRNTFVRRLQFWNPQPVSIRFKTDATVLNAFTASQTNIVLQPSKDAELAINDGKISITDAVAGKQYGLKQAQAEVLNAAGGLQSSTLKLQPLAVNPPLTAKLLEPYKAKLEKTLNQPVSFTIGNKTITPTPNDIAGWLEITPNDKTKKVDIAVNSGKVLEYINAAAASSIHPAKAQIETTAADGAVNVLVAGVNGVDVTNKSDVATETAKNLLDGAGVSQALAINNQAFKTITTGDYDKWIEVDLTNKRMYAYEKSNLVKTELVTAGAPSTPTVTGQYAIYSKFDQQDMRGANVDGSSYFQPQVRWISYFYRDYAIHGNYWRPLSYFGNINSSHGCVSLVDDEAQWMYDWAPVGTPVIVHA